MVLPPLENFIDALHRSRGLAHKRDIAAAVAALGIADPQAAIAAGDDCAAIPDGEAFLLLAIEGFLNEFVARDPWFAGWCGVMVNASDIYAMGGRPIAVVDAIWGRDPAYLQPVLEGMAAASARYGIPVVGGHSNARSTQEQLSVAILGRARRLLTSFDARPGDVLLAAIDLRGAYRGGSGLNWNAATGADSARLRGDLELLPQLAEEGLCLAAKDISQAGVIGTAMMLLECSGVGATIDLTQVPRPADVAFETWLISTFPSYGFVLAVAPAQALRVQARFTARGIDCAVIGRCDDTHRLRLRGADGAESDAWDFDVAALTGCGPKNTPPRSAIHA